MSLGDVLHESERLRIRRGEGWLVIEHSPGKDGVPSQRRLPEGRGVEWLGGLVGLLGGLAFMAAHRVTRDLTPVPVRLELGPRLVHPLRARLEEVRGPRAAPPRLPWLRLPRGQAHLGGLRAARPEPGAREAVTRYRSLEE